RALIRQRYRLQLFEAIAGAWVLLWCFTAQVLQDAPDSIEPGGDRAFDPAWRPGNVVAGDEDAALLGRQPVLDEMAIHPVVIAVVAGQGALECAQEVGI